jgi:hypothetical protein
MIGTVDDRHVGGVMVICGRVMLIHCPVLPGLCGRCGSPLIVSLLPVCLFS